MMTDNLRQLTPRRSGPQGWPSAIPAAAKLEREETSDKPVAHER